MDQFAMMRAVTLFSLHTDLTDKKNIQVIRHSTGIEKLDAALGGGLIPGTLTVVLGATGIGKTQLGITYADAGAKQEGERGSIFDLTTRGDSQNQADYAKRICGWELVNRDPELALQADAIWDRQAARADFMHVFRRSGRRVTIQDMEREDWIEFKSDLMRKLDRTIGFFYGNFVHGVRRTIIDGVEPTDRDSDSFQFHLFDYIYHQILRKDDDWVARDLFRAAFRKQQDHIDKNRYDFHQISSVLLYTSHEVMLHDLIRRPIQSGDVLSNANTIIMMGKTETDGRIGRAIYVAKHRGSRCDETIMPYQITEEGIQIL